MRYSINWNPKEGCFIASVKLPPPSEARSPSGKMSNGKWKTKFLPKKFGRKEQVEAEGWLHQWYHNTIQADGKSTPSAALPGKKTIAVLAPKWLDLRSSDHTRTANNTLRGFHLSVKNWILDNPDFPHHSIQNLDVETELTVQDVRSWILSLKGERSSKLQHISTLSSLFNDCAGEEWLSPDFVNPFLKAPIRKLVRDLQKKRKAEHFVTHLTREQVEILLVKPHYKVRAYRRMRYLVGIGTMLRDSEIQGLTWDDIKMQEPIPYVRVDRQLEKIGQKPFQRFEELIEQGLTREEASQVPQALMCNPKYDSKRMIPLHPTVMAGLVWWKEQGWKKMTGRSPMGDDPVFPNEEAGFCFSDSSMLIQQDLERLSLPTSQKDEEGKEHPIVFHSTRHTGSTLLEAAGVSEVQIGALLGHGAKSVARSAYLGSNLALFAELIGRMPLPKAGRVLETLEACG